MVRISREARKRWLFELADELADSLFDSMEKALESLEKAIRKVEREEFGKLRGYFKTPIEKRFRRKARPWWY